MGGIGNYRHGYRPDDGSYNSTYAAWRSMKGRCSNPRNAKFQRYGGRGVTVCSRWLGKSGFANFLADMGDKPKGLTLGRINNDGNYEPTNCRWETPKQQARNTSKSRLTEAQVREILARRGEVARVVAADYGVCRHSVYKIWDGSNWKDVALST